MGKKKIKFDLFKDELPYRPQARHIVVRMEEFYTGKSEHGRSTGLVVCPCCSARVEVFIWSFAGGGKRCTNCNVFLCRGGAYIELNELTDAVELDRDHMLILKSIKN